MFIYTRRGMIQVQVGCAFITRAYFGEELGKNVLSEVSAILCLHTFRWDRIDRSRNGG